MKHQVLRTVIGLWGLLLAMPLSAQSYASLWKKVETAVKADLPQSALQTVEKIYAKAEKERNYPHLLKARMAFVSCRSNIAPDSLYTDMFRMEQEVAGATDPVYKSLLQTVLGRMYAMQATRMRADMRRVVAGERPPHPADWTQQMMFDRALECYREALTDFDRLGAVSVDDYEVLIEKGEESHYFNHDLLSLQVREVLNMPRRGQPEGHCTLVKELYERLAAYYASHANREALLLVELDKANYIYRYGDRSVQDFDKIVKTYREELQRLLCEYGDCETAPRIYEAYIRNESEPGKVMQWCEEALQRYPKYKRANVFRDEMAQLTNPALWVRIPNVMSTGDSLSLDVTALNLKELRWTLREAGTQKAIRQGVYPLGKEVPAYERVAYKVMLAPVLTPGDYMLDVTFGKEKQTVPFLVTSLYILCKDYSNGTRQVVVLDRRSGHPVPGAQVELLQYDDSYRRRQYTSLQKLVTDAEGKADFTDINVRNRAVWAQKEGYGRTDTLSRTDYARGIEGKTVRTDIKLYTDRAVYRPGQTVQVSGLVYEQKENEAQVVSHRKVALALQKRDGNVIVQREAESNDFGSFSTQFVLPASCLPGGYMIVVSNGVGRVPILVEEYKRPTFEVEMLPVQQTYALGDSLQVYGKALTLAGAPVQQAKVVYTVHRASWYWWNPMDDNGEVLATGEVSTDAQGNFAVPVRLAVNQEEPLPRYWQMSYRVKVEVTGNAGETQTGYRMLRLGENSLNILSDIESVWIKGSRKALHVQVENLDRQRVEKPVDYAVYVTQRVGDDRQEVRARCVAEGTVVSGKPFQIEAFDREPSGSYRVLFTVKDDRERAVTDSTDVVTFAWDDKRIPVKEPLWSYSLTPGWGTGEENIVSIGTSEKDVYLMYDVLSGDQCIESRHFILNDSVLTFRYEDKPEYKEDITVRWAMVKDGQLHEGSKTVRYKGRGRELALKWETFRDRLTPGEQEEWRLKIERAGGKPVQAELLATMYDKALDHYRPLVWNLSLYSFSHAPWISYERLYEGQDFMSFVYPRKPYKLAAWNYDRWAYERIPFFRLFAWKESNKTYVAGRAALAVGASGVQLEESVVQFAAPQLKKDASVNDEAVASEAVTSDEPEALSPSTQLRSDFNETAFFYPHIRTDENGVATIAFTLPQSLTTWQFMGLAHTKDMRYGQIAAEAVASKEFMLQQHLPRFVRVGDEAVLSATLDNRSEQSVKGKVRMELFDPMTEKVIFKDKQPFTLEAGKSRTVTFGVKVSDKYTLLACRMVAESDRFSDGEQRYLPVLSNKEWVTESRMVTVNRQGRYEVALDSLFNRRSDSATQRRLTVEFTNNPMWLAVMALPSLAAPSQDDAVSLVAAYYATRLGGWVVEQHPRIKAVFEAWRAQGGTGETLWSNLQKNRELKAIVLEETPWLDEAADESEQRARLATLFDLNNLQAQAKTYLARLEALQRADGAWSWFKGMQGSRYVTTHVVETLVRLNKLTGGQYLSEMQVYIDRGLLYLGEDLVTEWQEAKKSDKKKNAVRRPSEPALHYLYIHALYGKKLSRDITLATGYFYGKLAAMPRDLSIYGKAAAAQVLALNGNRQAGSRFVQSLLEYSVVTPELGRYYDTDRAHESWADYRIPTQVMVIEACRELGVARDTVAAYQQWLLKQKQVQAWDHAFNSVNAVYALLTDNSASLDEQPTATLTLDGRPVAAGQSTTGLGYVKERIEVADKQKAPRRLVVEQPVDRLAWGSVYAQYLEDLDKVKADNGSLSIKRSLLVRRLIDGNEIWQEVQPGTALHVGDRVLSRLTIRTDRDMDFVQIVDRQAACLEPGTVLSGYRYDYGLGYYRVVKDASVQYFMDALRKGIYRIDMEYSVTRAGEYQSGTAVIQSAYSPELVAHTAGLRLTVAP